MGDITASVVPGATPNTGVEMTPSLIATMGTPSVLVPTDSITVDAGGTLTVNGIFEAVLVGITGGSVTGTSIVLRNLPTSSLLVGSHATGQLVFCTDGDSGSPCLAVYDGTSFKRIVLGATVSP
jgi:hypothetical protein